MADHRLIIEENAAERRRLAATAAGLTEQQLSLVLPNGWTVAVALAHMAFWDLRQVTGLRRWVEQGVKIAWVDSSAVNEALGILSAAIAGKAAVALALDAAGAVDAAVEKLSDAQVQALLEMGNERTLRRSLHRKEHLDKILAAIGK